MTIDRDGNDSPGVTAPADPCASLNVTALVRALGEGPSPARLDGARIATAKQRKPVTAEVSWKREPWGWVLEAHLHEAKRAIRDVHHRFSFDDGGGVDATLHFTLRP